MPTTGKRLILNDGTIIEDGEAGYSLGFLWLWFTGYTLPEAASMFFDPSKTSHIVFQYGEMEDEYNRFTNCTTLQIDMDNRVAVCLTRVSADA